MTTYPITTSPLIGAQKDNMHFFFLGVFGFFEWYVVIKYKLLEKYLLE